MARSIDLGRTFSSPTALNADPLELDWGPDARPKIAVDVQGRVLVVFAIFKDKNFNGQVLFTRSTDGGKSFAPLAPITADRESQRFESIALDPDGSLFAAWLDKRNRVPAKARNEPMRERPLLSHGRTITGRRFWTPGSRRTIRVNAVASGSLSPGLAVR